jgi:hypothetical protein
MKTAMQELMQWMEETEFMVNVGFIEKVNECLEIEKEQIVNAYNHNMTGFDKLEQEEIGLNWAEDYYNQTYNQTK